MSNIVRVGKIGLAVALDWRTLTMAGSRVDEQIIRERVRENDAERIVLVPRTNGDKALGMYLRQSYDDGGEGEKPPSKVYAAAAVLAALTGDAENIVAALSFVDGGREMIAVMVIEGGLPVTDTVLAPEAAQEAVQRVRAGEHGFSGHRIFSNSNDLFAVFGDEVEPLDFEKLAESARPPARLVRPPVNLRVLLSTLVVLVLVAGGAIGGNMVWKDHQAKKRAAEARARDPLPKYQAALADQIHQLGLSRESLGQLMHDLSSYPVWVRGWELKQVDCAAAGCRSTWERKGGTTADLTGSRPSEKLVSAESTADLAILSWEPKLQLAGWTQMEQAPTLADSLAKNVNVFQTWANAGIAMQQSGTFSVWPETGLEVPAEAALRTQPVEIRLPWMFAQEAMRQAPAEIFWTGLTLKVDISGKAQALLVTMKGSSYVR